MSRNRSEWERAPDLPDDHYVSSEIYTDSSVFEKEISNIFMKNWKFACHESEIPEKGDYRTINHSGWPLIIHRGDDDVIRAFINSCSHRSALVAREPRGNAKTLTCFFHLWGFNDKGQCVNITKPDGYQKCSFVRPENMGLRHVRCEVQFGMIFVNLSDEAISLEEYIGNAFENIEKVISATSMEVFHLHRVKIDANWKQWHETNMELYHEWGHVTNRSTSIMASEYQKRKWKIHPNGHGWLDSFKVEYKNYKGWEQRDRLMLPGLSAGEFHVVDLFPNTTILIRGTVMRIDTSIPISPTLTIVEQRGLGLKGEPAEDRRVRQRDHNQFWGPLGRNIAEDALFVEAVSAANQRRAARWGLFARHEDLLPQDDEIMRAYYRVWSREMGVCANNPNAE